VGEGWIGIASEDFHLRVAGKSHEKSGND
jgi:hypothetical protein